MPAEVCSYQRVVTDVLKLVSRLLELLVVGLAVGNDQIAVRIAGKPGVLGVFLCKLVEIRAVVEHVLYFLDTRTEVLKRLFTCLFRTGFVVVLAAGGYLGGVIGIKLYKDMLYHAGVIRQPVVLVI